MHDLDLEELLGLVHKFHEYDTDNTGYLTYDDFLKAIQTLTNSTSSDLDNSTAEEENTVFSIFDRFVIVE